MQRKIEQTIFYISFPLAFFGFILPLYANQVGATPLEIGFLFSVFSLVSILMRPLVGAYIDWRGRKGAMIFGLGAYAALQGMLWLGSGYLNLLCARVLQSVGSSFLWVSADAMIADLSKGKNYAGNYGSFLQAANRGNFIGSFIGFSLLFGERGAGAMPRIFAIFFAISLYALFRGLRDLQETRVTCAITPDSNLESKISPHFRRYITLVGLLSLTGSMLAPVFLLYIQEQLAVSIMLISLAYIPGSILSNFLPKIVGKWADQYGRKRFMIIGLALDTVFVCLWPLARSLTMFILLNMALVFASTLTSPARTAIVSTLTGENHFGRAYGYYHTAIGIGGVIGPVVGTYIYQTISGNLLFYLNGAATLFMAVAVYFLIPDSRPQQIKTG